MTTRKIDWPGLFLALYVLLTLILGLCLLSWAP